LTRPNGGNMAFGLRYLSQEELRCESAGVIGSDEGVHD
jgi:hypothetical protein